VTFPPPVQAVSVGATSGTGQTVGASDGWEAPLAGNTILVVATCADRLSNLTAPSGYIAIGERQANGCPIVTGFVKATADGTESSVLIDWSRDDEWCAVIFEFDVQDVVAAPAKNGTGDADNGTDSLSSTTTTVEGFAMALFASLAQNGEDPSYTNSFVHFMTAMAGGSSNLALDVAVGSANADEAGAYETTATWVSSSGRSSMCLAVDIAYVGDEKKKDYQRSSSYRVIAAKGHVAYTPEGEVLIQGKNHGQARKLMAQLVASKGPFRLDVEP